MLCRNPMLNPKKNCVTRNTLFVIAFCKALSTKVFVAVSQSSFTDVRIEISNKKKWKSNLVRERKMYCHSKIMDNVACYFGWLLCMTVSVAASLFCMSFDYWFFNEVQQLFVFVDVDGGVPFKQMTAANQKGQKAITCFPWDIFSCCYSCCVTGRCNTLPIFLCMCESTDTAIS